MAVTHPAGDRYQVRVADWADLPVALARLHGTLPAGASTDITWPSPPGGGGPEGLARVDAVMRGAGFDDMAIRVVGGDVVVRATRARTLPDVVGAHMRALICGLNPSLVSADAGFAFAGANNRFWGAALAAGLVRTTRQPFVALAQDGVGFTDMVKRATARSHHLEPGEYAAGAARVRALTAWLRPAVVIFVGLEGWRAAVDRRARPGWQAHGFSGGSAYVMPSTSGANAHTTPSALADHFQAALAGPPPTIPGSQEPRASRRRYPR